jgi:EAL domain-containing protein (putative c-di-GMP-specific phosphodiesterase class I)
MFVPYKYKELEVQRDLGCVEFQGYLFSRPMAASALALSPDIGYA